VFWIEDENKKTILAFRNSDDFPAFERFSDGGERISFVLSESVVRRKHLRSSQKRGMENNQRQNSSDLRRKSFIYAIKNQPNKNCDPTRLDTFIATFTLNPYDEEEKR
jgi:hypothetical protein